MAQLRRGFTLGIALFACLGAWIYADGRSEAREMTPLCQDSQGENGFDKALVYIQSAQAYLTGQVDGADPEQCPEGMIGQFLSATDDPTVLGKFYAQRLERRDAMSSVEARYAWDVETLFQINLECDSDWDCAHRRISSLIADGLKPSQSLVFCGFDENPSPDVAETEGLTGFRNPQVLPFICDELLGGSDVSDGWRAAYADYFDAR